VPIALGVVAPFSGALSDRHPRGTRLVGMMCCTAAAIGLGQVLDGTPESLGWVMAGLALYGAGLGLFIAPNNSLTLAAAPAARSGQAGGLLNLMRAFGTALGVGMATALMAWRLEVDAGVTRIEQASGPVVLEAVWSLMALLAVLAALAAALSLLRDRAPEGGG
jgi:MFS family permease